MHPSKYHCMTIWAHLPRVWPPLGFLKADIQTNMYHWHLVTPGRCPMVPHHHDGHEPSSCEQKINHLSFVMNSAKAISLFIFFKWNRDNIKVRKYIRKNYLSWVDVILSCLFNLAQMFVCWRNLASSNDELKGWLIQLLGLDQKLTTDREMENVPRTQFFRKQALRRFLWAAQKTMQCQFM